MMVARHEIPGKGADTIRPVGNGMMWDPKLVHRTKRYEIFEAITPYPTGRTLVEARSGHFMPGYHHIVSPGQHSLPNS
jgi:hypothetical protein